MLTKANIPEGYKQTEVGIIPEDWGVTTVGNEFSIQLGKMLDSEKNTGIPKPYLGNRAIQWWRVIVNDIGVIKLTASDLKRFRLIEGDLLVCEGGEIGRAAIWHDQLQECYYQKALHRLRPIRGYNVQLMLNILQRFASTGFLRNFVTQTSIAHLPKDKFVTVPIPLPPTNTEQEAIAMALSDVDGLIASLDNLITKKRNIKQGTMQQILTGKKRLPGFCGEWEIKKLGEIAVIKKGQLITEKTVIKGNVPVVAGGKTPAYYHNESNRKGSTITISASGANAGYVAFYEQPIFASDCSTIEDCKDYSVKFIYYQLILKQQEIYYSQTGGAQPHIHPIDLYPIEIPCFSFDEQQAITQILSDIDNEIKALKHKRDKYKSIKQGMMQELLTGKTRLV